MYPAYRYMDSYPHGPHPHPHQRDHMHPPYYQYPPWESIPPHMRVETSKPPSAWGPGPYRSDACHGSPAECGGCCMHSYPHGHFGFRPPYPQPVPQSYYGPHGYHEPYSYFVPPPHYSVDNAVYDYDKMMPRGHCCGCPNHAHRVGNGGVRVEEQSSEGEQQDSGASSLIRLPNNSSSPIVWIPSGNLKGKEEHKKAEPLSPVWHQNNPYQLVRAPSNSFVGKEDNKKSEAQTNGWVPLDVQSLKDMMRAANEKKSPPADENKNKLSWPLIWIPGNYEAGDVAKDKEESASSKAAEDVLPKLKIIPMKLVDDRAEKPDTAEQQKSHGSPAKENEKETKTKTVPVKQIEESRKEPSVHEKQKEKDNGVNGVKKTNDGKQNGQSKASKLPPVCLRVDPLPKKNGNGKSRSPSPPSHKEERKQSLTENKEETSAREIPVVVNVVRKPEHDIEKQKQERKDVEKQKQQSKGQEVTVNIPVEPAKQPVNEEKDTKILEKKNEETKDEDTPKVEDKSDLNAEGKMSEKRSKILAPVEAAVLIQSAYRGYQVRKWQPLKKLKRIAEIQKQVDGVGKQIKDLETSTSGPDKKQFVIMNETIMSLLLQLDTIQGMHQSVREARKAVARELTTLQERLDAVSKKVSKAAEKKQDTVADITAASDHPVSVVAASSAENVLEEEKSTQVESESCTMEEKIMDGQEVHSSASEGQAEITVHEVPVTAEGDPVQHQVKVDVQAVAVEDEQILNSKVSDSVEKNEESSAIASEGATAEESDVKDSTSMEGYEESALVKTPSYIDNNEASEPDSKELAPKEDEMAETSVLLAPDVQVAPSITDVGQVNTELLDEASVSTLPTETTEATQVEVANITEVPSACTAVEVGQASPELFDEASVPTLPVETTEATSPLSEPDVEVAGMTEVPSVAAELPTSPVGEPIAKAEVASSVMDDSELTKDATEPPNGTDKGEDAGLEEDETECVKETIAEDQSMAGADTDIVQDKPTQNVEMPIEAPIQGIVEAATEDRAIVAEEAQEQHEDNVVDNKIVTPKEESIGATDELVHSTEVASETPVTDSVVEHAPHVEDSSEETSGLSKEEIKLVQENEKLREMLERLLEAGKAQLGVIAELNGRVKDLEKKLSKKRVRSKRHKMVHPAICKVTS